MRKYANAFLHHVVGWKPWKRRGSRQREVATRVVFVISVVLFVEAVLATRSGSTGINAILAWSMCAGSVLFFTLQLIVIPFRTTQGFQMDARRLARDALVSTLFVIMAFSLVYRQGGIVGPEAANALDHVYFSAVTFSTLGYGDFRPSETAFRLVAGLQAIVGNLHLAVIVGAIFLRMSRRKPREIE